MRVEGSVAAATLMELKSAFSGWSDRHQAAVGWLKEYFRAKEFPEVSYIDMNRAMGMHLVQELIMSSVLCSALRRGKGAGRAFGPVDRFPQPQAGSEDEAEVSHLLVSSVSCYSEGSRRVLELEILGDVAGPRSASSFNCSVRKGQMCRKAWRMWRSCSWTGRGPAWLTIEDWDRWWTSFSRSVLLQASWHVLGTDTKLYGVCAVGSM